MPTPTPGIYRHYKGKLYEVVGVAHHSETIEELVVYTALYKTEFGHNSLWVRPRKMFLEKIKMNGKLMKRFTKIRPKVKSGKSSTIVKSTWKIKN